MKKTPNCHDKEEKGGKENRENIQESAYLAPDKNQGGLRENNRLTTERPSNHQHTKYAKRETKFGTGGRSIKLRATPNEESP